MNRFFLRGLAFFLSLLLLVSAALPLLSCRPKKQEGRFLLVTTVFAVYDWTREILGERGAKADLVLLTDSGTDMHSLQPTVDDLICLHSADLVVLVGGESEKWVAEALLDAPDTGLCVNLLAVLGDNVYEEEHKEGMQGGHNHGRDPGHEEAGHEGHDHEEKETDEHVWLSLKRAKLACRAIADALITLDPDGEAIYRGNCARYEEKLAALDSRYRETVGAAKRKTLIFGDRFPFRYLTGDYSLDYYAAFPGCSAETDASFGTVIGLARRADEVGAPVILTLEGSDGRIARQIAACTVSGERKILPFDSMQSVTAEKIRGGMTYLSVMERNLSVLDEALR